MIADLRSCWHETHNVALVVTVVQLIRRKRSWPFTVATLALCTITVFLGGVGCVLAVG